MVDTKADNENGQAPSALLVRDEVESEVERAEAKEQPVLRHRVDHVTRQEAIDRGRAARRSVPRSTHATWEPPVGRTSPVAILAEQATSREPDLVPIRHGRMLVLALHLLSGSGRGDGGGPGAHTGLRTGGAALR